MFLFLEMGLSSKQVSGDQELIDWTQTVLGSGSLELPKPRPTRRQQQQQSDPLKCPRCESTNTKFCYYNNYNKLQPRHFCKACKRHWTKGGTLRNVPVGGGRKNKRLKRPCAATNSTSTTATMAVGNNGYMGHNLPLGHAKASDRKSIGSEGRGLHDLYTKIQGLNGPTWDINCSFMGSTQNQSLGFSFSSLSSFDANPNSIPSSFPSLNGIEKLENMEEDSIITTIMPSCTSTISQQWQVPSTSSFMDMPNYWNWNDLNIPWDEDSEFKL